MFEYEEGVTELGANYFRYVQDLAEAAEKWEEKEQCGPPGRVAETGRAASRHIPMNVKHNVWRRDGGACVECGSRERLEYDHILPFSKGGASTYRNVQLLCEPCNRTKSASI